jgi:dinuclear metal center YbgI/SA1388 family protein
MATLREIIAYCNEVLSPGLFRDYCPNGLQVEGSAQVGFIVSGVTASQALIDEAVSRKADLLLVHHGFFWKGEEPCITGMKQRRISALIRNDISLLAYHLPLDAHVELGNNAQLASYLGLEIDGTLNEEGIGLYGHAQAELSLDQLGQLVEERLERVPLLVSGGDHPAKRIGWCTGAAQNYIEQAAALGMDAFISGEVSEQTVHTARELGIHYIAAGHHATERYGVRALGDRLASVFGISHQFVDIANPV